MPIVAVSTVRRVPDDPSRPSGDRLHFPVVQALGDRWHKGPEWLQPFKEGLSGESPRLTQCRGGTTDDMRVSSEEESTNLPFVADRAKRPNTSKPTGRHSIFAHFPKGPNSEVCKITETTRTPCRNRLGARGDRIRLKSRKVWNETPPREKA